MAPPKLTQKFGNSPARPPKTKVLQLRQITPMGSKGAHKLTRLLTKNKSYKQHSSFLPPIDQQRYQQQ